MSRPTDIEEGVTYPDGDVRKTWLDGEQHGKRAAAHHYRGAIVALYKVLGFEPGTCRSCGAPIWWGTTKAGKAIPLTRDGVAHFTDCPRATEHRKRK